jgi:hypothetical protein
MKLYSGNACLTFVLLLIVSGSGVPSAHAQDRMLTGQVLDAQGTGVAGTTVFVTQLDRVRGVPEWRVGLRAATAAGEPTDRVVKSGQDGTFSLLLPVGLYRIAAFKPGYEVGLVEVHLLARNLVEVRMRAGGKPMVGQQDASAEQARGLDWILRRSDRDALRDVEAGLAVPLDAPVFVSGRGGRVAGGPASGLRLPPVDGELVQDFSGSSLFGGGISGPGDSSGRSTRLALRGAFGDEGAWRFDGLAGRTTAALAGGEDTRAGRATMGLGVGFDCRLGPSDGLKSEARYASSRYFVDPGAAADGLDQEQETAALRARWDRKLGDDVALYVTGSYLEAAVRRPAETQGLLQSPAAGGAGVRRGDRSVGAAAGLALQSEDHTFGMGLRIHSYRYDLGDDGAFLSGVDSRAAPLEAGRMGSALSLFGGDDWRVADRYVLNYGLGYHNDLTSGSAYVVPRVGLTTTLLEAGDLRVRSAVMYRVDDTRPSPPVLSAADGRDAHPEGGRLGYEIGVERRPEHRLQFAATLSYRPFQETIDQERAATSSAGLFDEGELVMADAAAGRHEMGIEMQRGFGFVRGILMGSVGRVQGRLSPVLEEGPLLELQAGQARYYLTVLKAMIEPTETEVRIDYRRVVGQLEAPESGAGAAVDYRRLDFAVFQDLPFSPLPNARWRVLMAYQGLLYDSIERSSSLPGSAAASRVTGGVDISF